MSQLPWYVARASGVVAWMLLSSAVVWGLLMSTRALGRRPHSAWLLDLHRFLGGLAAIFTVLHVLAVLADGYVHFTLWAVLVPGASSWRPLAIAWGVVGLYLVAAVELTSLARRRLPQRMWRAVHFASFPLFVVATLHAATAGEDVRSTFAIALIGAVSACVAVLTLVRVVDAGSAPRRVPDRGRVVR